MKINKLLWIIAFIFCQKNMNAMEIVKDSNNPLKLLELPEEILIKILEPNLEITYIQKTCKKINKITKELFKQKWDCLEKQNHLYFLSQAIKTINSLGSQEVNYDHFTKLYYYMADQINWPKYKEKNINITDPQLYINMDEHIQEMHDENLLRIWPKIHREITRKAEGLILQIPNNGDPVTAKQIRDYLNDKTNQESIKRVTRLYLGWMRLNCLPIELSLFTNLKKLDLAKNQLKSISIPETLVNLKKIYLGGNSLKSIEIPDTLTNLEKLYLHDNQIRSITIPDTLIKLKKLSLSYNRLTSLEIPETLTNLTEIDIEYNLLIFFKVPDNLIDQVRFYSQENEDWNCIIS